MPSVPRRKAGCVEAAAAFAVVAVVVVVFQQHTEHHNGVGGDSTRSRKLFFSHQWVMIMIHASNK